MFLIEVDQRLNRLHIVYTGSLDKAQAKSLLNQLENRLPELASGFEIVTDLSDAVEISYPAKRYIRKAMDLCNAAGVGRIVRIVPHTTKNFGFSVMSNFHYDKRIPIIVCESRNEAAAKMAETAKRVIHGRSEKTTPTRS